MSYFITYKNTAIHFKDIGKGNAIVLLHGFLENHRMWEDLIPLLQDKYRIVSIDLLGHGKTECMGYIHTMELMAETVMAVIKHLKLRRVTLVGHSMGGYVSLALADVHPDYVKGLVLMNSTARADTPEKQLNRSRAIALVKQNHTAFIRMSITNLFRPKNRSLFRNKVNTTKKEALKTPLQGIVAALEGMKIRPDREVLLHFSPYKKMMVLGKKDPILDYSSLIAQTQNTEVEVVELPDGHMSHIEDFKLFSSNLIHFIENL
ncbi:MAG: alpha/beta hydrolase [Flavobacteriaceae bacterium]|nr:alpha/beta hydrolase [Flavobacteriaceae bacterium]